MTWGCIRPGAGHFTLNIKKENSLPDRICFKKHMDSTRVAGGLECETIEHLYEQFSMQGASTGTQ